MRNLKSNSPLTRLGIAIMLAGVLFIVLGHSATHSDAQPDELCYVCVLLPGILISILSVRGYAFFLSLLKAPRTKHATLRYNHVVLNNPLLRGPPLFPFHSI